jgi:hypothetical protein
MAAGRYFSEAAQRSRVLSSPFWLLMLCAFLATLLRYAIVGEAAYTAVEPPTPLTAFVGPPHTPGVYCADLPSLFSGSWAVQRAGTALRLGAWQPAAGLPCAGAPSGSLLPLAPLRRGRRLSLAGDSVTRYCFIDVAMELFHCGAALRWDGVACHGSGGGGGGGASAACAALAAFACTGKKHESVLISDANASLHFVWVPWAEDLHKEEFKKFLENPPDALVVSLGFWDVAVKSEGQDKSVAHHCAWMSMARDLLANARSAAPRLKASLLFWQPPATEPIGGNDQRIPQADMGVVDGCSKIGFGDAFVNTTVMLSVPQGARGELQRWAAADPVGGGALLTVDGFHPRREVRTVLLNALLLHFYGQWGEGTAAGSPRG